MTLHTDHQAQLDGPDGECLCGTAIYDITDDYVLDYRKVELVSMQIGRLVLTRYQVVDAVGEPMVSQCETWVSEHVDLPDAMGAAADREYDRYCSDMAAQ